MSQTAARSLSRSNSRSSPSRKTGWSSTTPRRISSSPPPEATPNEGLEWPDARYNVPALANSPSAVYSLGFERVPSPELSPAERIRFRHGREMPRAAAARASESSLPSAARYARRERSAGFPGWDDLVE